MKIREVVSRISKIFPIEIVSGQDNVGLIAGNYDDECKKMTVAYELNAEALKEAAEARSNLIVSYHTPLYKSAKSFTSSLSRPNFLFEASRLGVNVFSVHTALDVVRDGLNFDLARKMGLKNIRFLSPLADTLFKIVVFAPSTHAEQVEIAMSRAGGGRIGNYSECSFSVAGKGAFLPGDDANPFIGSAGKKEVVDELRLEMVADKHLVGNVIKNMLDAHPYEEPAFDVYPLAGNSPNYGFGAMGDLEVPVSTEEFFKKVKELLEIETLKISHMPDIKIRKVALCAGAGVPFYGDAVRSGADVFITGDVKHHDFRDAKSNAAILADATHNGTEKFAAGLIYDMLGETFKNELVVEVCKHQEHNAIIV